MNLILSALFALLLTNGSFGDLSSYWVEFPKWEGFVERSVTYDSSSDRYSAIFKGGTNNDVLQYLLVPISTFNCESVTVYDMDNAVVIRTLNSSFDTVYQGTHNTDYTYTFTSSDYYFMVFPSGSIDAYATFRMKNPNYVSPPDDPVNPSDPDNPVNPSNPSTDSTYPPIDNLFGFVMDLFNDSSTISALTTALSSIPSELMTFAIISLVVLLLAVIIKVILNVL